MKSDITVCTIIAKNYLAQARTFASSFRAQHPEIPIHVLVADQIDGRFDPKNEIFTVVSLDELGFEDGDSLTFKYTLLELSTAVKPQFLTLLFRRGFKKVLFFDPDILITNPLDNLFAELDTADAILTPHIITPIPGKEPAEQGFLTSGIYNLGFVGFRSTPDVEKFLTWWHKRLMNYCIVRTNRGLFVDQKWADLLPAFIEKTRILRYPGYNVAYWNLHERTVSRLGDTWLVNDVPLCFYHFSGYNPDLPLIISKHDSHFDFENKPELRELFEEYREKMISNGYRDVRKWPYAFGFYNNGKAIANEERLIYSVEYQKHSFGNPYTTESKSSFYHTARLKHRVFRAVKKGLIDILRSSWFQQHKGKLKKYVSPEMSAFCKNILFGQF